MPSSFLSAFSACIALLVLAPLFTPAPLSAADGPSAAEYGTVLNLSGRQRMLSQRMTKEALLIALDVDKAANLENLAKSSALFDTTLKGLEVGDDSVGLPPATSKRVLRQLSKVKKLWGPFKGKMDEIAAEGGLKPSAIGVLSTMNLPLLKEMNRCVKLFEREAANAGLESKPEVAVVINLAGKQRMLTQKMSKEFLLIALEVDVEQNKLALTETITLFEKPLAGLKDGDETLELPGTQTPDIRAQLEVVGGLWTTFKPAISKGTAAAAPDADAIAAVAAQNVPLLVEMNKAVKLFEGEAAN